MSFLLISVGVGLLLGLAAGGYPRHVFQQRWNLWPLLLVGLALQVIPEIVDLSESQALIPVLGSFAALIVFGCANLSTMGMAVVVLGLGLNMAATATNKGMAVDGPALVNAGIAQPEDLETLDLGSRRHVSGPTDRLQAIGDIIPVKPLNEVLSFGDLIMSFGTANVAFRLLRPVARRRKSSKTLAVTNFVVPVTPVAPVVIDLSLEDLAFASEWAADLQVPVTQVPLIDLTNDVWMPPVNSQPSVEVNH